ncbi:MAG: cytochrome b/b6 domain-containing protein, partial [Roseobacter sp.]
MPLSNTAQHYGSISKTFHWLTALLILTLIPLGIYANDLPYDSSEQLARKAWFFSLHKTLGVTVFFVALARILWAIVQPKPSPLHPDRKLETFAGSMVHWLLYGSLLLVPLSGWVHHAATTGFAPIWWPLGQNLPLV